MANTRHTLTVNVSKFSCPTPESRWIGNQFKNLKIQISVDVFRFIMVQPKETVLKTFYQFCKASPQNFVFLDALSTKEAPENLLDYYISISFHHHLTIEMEWRQSTCQVSKIGISIVGHMSAKMVSCTYVPYILYVAAVKEITWDNIPVLHIMKLWKMLQPCTSRIIKFF